MNKHKIRHSLACVVAAAVLGGGVAHAGPPACNTRVNNTFNKLLECVTIEGVSSHLNALQTIADTYGNRASAKPGQNLGDDPQANPGYLASKNYVAGKLRSAGYQVQEQEFQYLFFQDLEGSVLEQTSPGSVSYALSNEFGVIGSTAPGDVTAAIQAVGLNYQPSDYPPPPLPGQDPLPVPGTAGCTAADFTSFTAGNIALIQRGGCPFVQKANNAVTASAAGIIIYNRGDLGGLPNATLGASYTNNVPVLEATYALGSDLRNITGIKVHMVADVSRGTITTYNILAETAGGSPDNVIMVGSHLDSVLKGAGINDNGTGSAAVLETALQMAKVKPVNKVRFVWWGAEEDGYGGSTYYLDHLSDAQLATIKLYLNFDMLGSKNFGRFVLNGDDAGLPSGSKAITTLFQGFYDQFGYTSKLDDQTRWNRSDSAIFAYRQFHIGKTLINGIPIGGLTAGYDELKTAAEVELFGGTAGNPYDSCYHNACDDINNVDYDLLGLNADAVAYATLQYAMNTVKFNGQKGKGNFKQTQPLNTKAKGFFQ